MKKWIYRILLVLLFIIVIAYFLFLGPRLEVLNNYVAKKACSSYFVGNRSIESISDEDFELPPFSLSKFEIEEEEMRATASFYGLKKKKAVFDPALGCRLIHGEDNYKVKFEKPIPSYLSSNDDLSEEKVWPYGHKELTHKVSGVDYDKIDEAFDLAFDKDGEWLKKTRALLVIHKDSLVKEQYSGDYTMDTRFIGWSMTKSICNTICGILERQGKLSVQESNLFEAWKNDDRKKLTVDNLLRMNTGLEWAEDYNNKSALETFLSAFQNEVPSATSVLFTHESLSDQAIAAPIEFTPETHWEYSSGTTNILSKYLKTKFTDHQSYLSFPYSNLFHRLDIHSAQMEVDETGYYGMSSFMYATGRDWAKLGLLYLHEGVWGQDTLFNKSWSDYSITPTPHSNEQYGAHIWLNGSPKMYPSCPDDTYKFSGYEGQYVFWIPSKDLVIVRLGLSKGPPFNLDAVLGKVVSAVQ